MEIITGDISKLTCGSIKVNDRKGLVDICNVLLTNNDGIKIFREEPLGGIVRGDKSEICTSRCKNGIKLIYNKIFSDYAPGYSIYQEYAIECLGLNSILLFISLLTDDEFRTIKCCEYAKAFFEDGIIVKKSFDDIWQTCFCNMVTKYNEAVAICNEGKDYNYDFDRMTLDLRIFRAAIIAGVISYSPNENLEDSLSSSADLSNNNTEESVKNTKQGYIFTRPMLEQIKVNNTVFGNNDARFKPFRSR